MELNIPRFVRPSRMEYTLYHLHFQLYRNNQNSAHTWLQFHNNNGMNWQYLHHKRSTKVEIKKNVLA